MAVGTLLFSNCGGPQGAHPDPVEALSLDASAARQISFPDARPQGFQEVDLVEKDATFRVVSSEDGGAHGVFWFRPRGASFDWFVRAEQLQPARAYRLLLNVDGERTYAVASFRTDEGGELKGYGSLDEFGERVCVGTPDFDPPTPTAGSHVIKTWVQDDGSRAAGSGSPRFLTEARNQDALPCSGNGDRSFRFILFEDSPIRFEGPAVRAADVPEREGSRS